MRSKALIGLGIVIILVVIAALAAPRFIDVNRYRPQIEAKLRDRLNRNVSLGPMRLSLIPLAFRADNVRIDEDPQFGTGRPFAQIQTLYVRPRLLPLLHHELEIKSLQLDRPALELIRNERGGWNFSSLVQHKQETEAQNPAAFTLDQAKVYDGRVAITDREQHKPRANYDHIDATISDFAPGRPVSADIRAHLPGPGNQTIALLGKIGPIQHDAVARTPVDGKLKLENVSLAGLQQFTNAEPLADSNAVLTGDADVKNNESGFASTGKFDIRNARVRGVDIGYPIAIDYQISGSLNQPAVQIEKANLKLGQAPLSFHGNINAQNTPAQIDLTAQTSDASLAEVARLAAAFGTAFNAGNQISGTLDMDVHAQGAVTKPVLNGQLSAKNVQIAGGDLREPVSVDGLHVALSPDNIRSNEFIAKTGHTSAAAQFTLTGYTSDSPKLDAKLNTGNADLQELLRIAHAYGISGVEGVNGSGVIGLNVSAQGPLKQLNEMTYDGSGTIRSATLELPSMSQPLAVRKADLRFSGNGAAVDNIDASIGQTTAQGNLTVKNFDSPQVQFSMSANHINVAEWEQLFQPPKEKAPARPVPRPAAAKAPKSESVLARARGTGTLKADKVVYDDLTLTNIQSSVTLDHGTITIKPLTASLYNGQQIGTIVVNTNTTPVTYTVDSKLQSVDANQLLSAISPVKQMLYGLLSATADTHFTTAAGAQSILPTLDGKVSLELKDGKIANVDLLHQLATIAQFQRSAGAVEPFTHLVQMTGDFDVHNGVARTNNLKAAIDAGSIAVNGIVDLAHEKLNLRLTAVLAQNYSQSVGGTNIGGFLNTALANNKGELVIPVVVTGTFQQPQFAPDLQAVASMKLQKLLPGVENPAGLGNTIFGQILRSKPGQPATGQQQQEQQPAKVNDLLNIFQKEKK
jgi:uncharacterized protein involved in outer membrane biogenesis